MTRFFTYCVGTSPCTLFVYRSLSLRNNDWRFSDCWRVALSDAGTARAVFRRDVEGHDCDNDTKSVF